MSYVSVQDLQKFTNVYPEDGDTLQQIYLGSATEIIESYLGYNPELQTYTNYFDGNGKNILFLNAKPISILQSVSINGVEQNLNDYYFDGATECLYTTDKFSSGTKNIKVVYTAGYSTVPDLIKLSALRIAGILQTEQSGNIGITSKSFQESGNRTFVNTVNFSKYLLPLSKYKLLG